MKHNKIKFKKKELMIRHRLLKSKYKKTRNKLEELENIIDWYVPRFEHLLEKNTELKLENENLKSRGLLQRIFCK